MNFFITKKLLYDSLSHFQSVVEKRNTIPILSNIKIKSKKNEIIITATDLSIQLSEVIQANVIKDGEVTIPSQLFFDIVKKIPESKEIEIKESSESGKVFILFGDSRFSLPYLPTSDFPEIENENFENEFILSSSKFKYLIDDCKFSMGLDESRQYLNGVYFHCSGEKIISVATDGHRLSKCQIENDIQIKSFEGIIIPKKTVNEISKILEEFDSELSICISKTKIAFTVGKVSLISKLVNANFPDYESVIPKSNNLIMTCDAGLFSDTIDRVSTISNEKFRTVKLEISNDICVVSSFGEEKSAGTEQIIVNYKGPKIIINFNARYILEVLSIFKNEKISISFAEDTAPTILQSNSNGSSLYLIMQMRA